MSRPKAAVLIAAFVALLLIGWGLGEAARSTAQADDLRAVRDLAANRTPTLTVIAHLLSLVGSGYVVFPLAVLCTIGCYIAGLHRAAALVGLSAAGAVVIANVDKLLVGRPRPPLRHLEVVTSSSFPSGHATQSAALLGALLLVLIAVRARRRVVLVAACAAFLLVAGIAASRVYLAVHYPTDVAGGILLASAWTLILAVVLARRNEVRGGSGDDSAVQRRDVREQR